MSNHVVSKKYQCKVDFRLPLMQPASYTQTVAGMYSYIQQEKRIDYYKCLFYENKNVPKNLLLINY